MLHLLTFQCLFVIFIAALSSAGEVRVGSLLGGGRPVEAKMTAYKATYFGAVMAVFSTGLLFCFAEQIPSWLTPDPTLQRMIFETLPLVSPIRCFGGRGGATNRYTQIPHLQLWCLCRWDSVRYQWLWEMCYGT